jgi:hypothetical protein
LIPKEVKSVSDQQNFESRKLWQNVTASLKRLDFATASEQISSIRSMYEKNPIGGKKSEMGELIPRFFSKSSDANGKNKYQFIPDPTFSSKIRSSTEKQ